MYGRIETGAQGNQIYISGLRPSAMRRYLNDLMGYFRVYTYRFEEVARPQLNNQNKSQFS